MEAPKRIWTGKVEYPGYVTARGPDKLFTQMYIRADLVDKLIGYAVHRSYCDLSNEFRGGDESCTCGLSDLIKEVRG